MSHLNEEAKTAFDILAGGTAFGALLQLLPPLAALLTIVWTAIRIYEWWKSKKLPKE